MTAPRGLPEGAGTSGLPLEGLARKGAASVQEVRDLLARRFRKHDVRFEAPADLRGFLFAQADVDGLAFNLLRYGAQASLTVPPLLDFYILQWTLAGRCMLRIGAETVELEAGSLFIMNPDLAYAKQWSADCAQLMVRVDRARIDRLMSGPHTGGPARFQLRPVEQSPDTAGLFSLLRQLCQDVEAGCGLAHPSAAPAAADLLVRLLLLACPSDAALPAPAPEAPYLAAAKDYIRLHAREPIQLADIAAASGARPRTLQKAFQGALGLSPITYLRMVRLDLARRELEHGRPGFTRVTSVAFDCGFEHLSKFARDYAKRFGEAPSRTLRRSQLAYAASGGGSAAASLAA